MRQRSAKESVKVKLTSGLGRMLVVSFLVFALFPLILISLVSYKNTHDSLDQEIRGALGIAARLKTREISAYFDNMLNQLRFQSEAATNSKLLAELTAAQQAFGKSPQEFVKSDEWSRIVNKGAGDLKKFSRSFNYRDILLITINGDILFSVAGENDLGTNLFAGPARSSKFAAACRRTLETGALSFSDYEHYFVKGAYVSGFLTALVVDQKGERIGFLAFQFPIDPISHIMEGGHEFGKTAQIYLVGPDLTLRSRLELDKTKKLIDDPILTDQTAKMKNQSAEVFADGANLEKAFVYRGPLGRTVLGISHDFPIENVVFTAIAEIEEREAFAAFYNVRLIMLLSVGLTVIAVLLFVVFIVRRIVKPIIQLSLVANRVAAGDFSQVVKIKAENEIGDLSSSFHTMIAALRKNRAENKTKEWFQNGLMEMNDIMRGYQDLTSLSRRIITYLSNYLDAEIGAFYITNKKGRLQMIGSYAFTRRKLIVNEVEFGQGLVGQAALEKERILLTRVPDDYITIQSGLGETVPRTIVVKPFIRDNAVLGVIELGKLEPFSARDLDFLDAVSENIAAGIQTILAHIRVQELLEQSQTQAEELETQQEELRQTNETLEKQAEALKRSEATLQLQQEELRQTNEELEEQANLLEEQKNSVDQKNTELEKTRREMEQKAKDLDIASRYKSEFLANMSHELRTPLNSILLLSKHLSDNKENNLTEKQVECAATVHTSGNELLNLINEVLDLSKVEAGKMILEPEDVKLTDITGVMERNFRPVAENKGLALNIHITEGCPESIRTDAQRVSQILKNLLSNALKFTQTGGISLEIKRRIPDQSIDFIVTDSGPGIPEDKQEIVFQAFRQADGSTSRQFGGTGLGLSISRELAGFLGGSLSLSSTLGKGSVFTLNLPESIEQHSAPTTGRGVPEPLPESGLNVATTNSDKGLRALARHASEKVSPDAEYLPDDRKTVNRDSKSILIIEDDPTFAKILRDTARERGFKALVAESGEAGLHLADFYTPDGIVLDMGLPGMDGRSVLFRLKDNLATRHIPVHIVSASDRTHEPMHMGAVGYLTKPVTMEAVDSAFSRIENVFSKKVKKVLVVEDDVTVCEMITNLVGDSKVKTITASTGREARSLLNKDSFDCMILDLGLPDMNALDLLNELRRESDFQLPVIIYTARDLTPQERAELDGLADSIVIKDTKSQEKLLDETCLFLHRVEADLPENKREMLKLIHNRDSILRDKKILIVDDDMRNVFALIAILEDKGVKTLVAENGRAALAELGSNADTDLVLMDIMMPEMDGYQAMQEIRNLNSKIARIPIIALTAKAMKGDRTKCIEAGASDYLSKPVDADKLLSMLRVWLY
ncbi:response regulator [bacterium]|nr:response regulator [bacterium]